MKPFWNNVRRTITLALADAATAYFFSRMKRMSSRVGNVAFTQSRLARRVRILTKEAAFAQQQK